MSLVLRELHELLPLAAAVGVCDACECEGSLPQQAKIKWPNDIWVKKRKIAGILIEGRPQDGWAVLGIGLNVDMVEEDFPPELRGTATSLQIEWGAPPIDQMVVALVRAMADWLAATPDEILAAWRKRDALKGERVSWADGEGEATGIDDSGALLVETDSGRVTLDAGEVHLGFAPP